MSDFKLGLESATPHHQRRPPQRGRWHRQKDKNHSPSAKNPVGRDTSRPPIILILYWLSIICRGREVSRPYHAKSFWEIWHNLLPRNHFIIRGFSPWNGERFLSLVQCGMPSWEGGGGIVWLAAWKLVSNDAKRTVAPPNAKHSTLLQGCFLCFCFWFHSQFGNIA